MKCACGGRTDAVDGRYVEQGYWRRRICRTCGTSSTTIEQVCVTEKGTRVKKPRVHVPKVPVVKLPRQRDPVHKPKILDAPILKKAEPPARHRIEDMKLMRELDLKEK